MVPTFDKTLDKVGVHTGGVTTTWLAGGPDLRRPLDPRFGQVIQTSVGHTYQEFLARAAASRHTSAEQIEEVAQGRVWTGRQARERHLVDGFGGLTAAIHDAAQQAKLGTGFRTAYIELEPRGLNRLLDILADRAARAVLRLAGPMPARLLPGIEAPLRVGDDIDRLLSGGVTPTRVLAHCLCRAP
jgi:protease-4